MPDSDLMFRAALELASMVRSGEISSRELVETSLARIEDQLAHTPNPARRQALEAARRELSDRLARLEELPGSADAS